MAQEKSDKQGVKTPAPTKDHQPVETPAKRDVFEDYGLSPDFWDRIFDSLPPWMDEIAAIVLLVGGVVSFLSLFNFAADTTISQAWSSVLTSLFGYGSIVVAAGILALGVAILLPKIGITITFPALRILAIEIAFLSLLAILHLATGDTELRAVARAGGGGGIIGWAFSGAISGLFGAIIAWIVYLPLFVISIAVAIGARWSHVRKALSTASSMLGTWSERFRQDAEQKAQARIAERAKAKPAPVIAPSIPAAAVTELPRRVTIMRIRPKIEDLPPSQRPGAAPPLESAVPSVVITPLDGNEGDNSEVISTIGKVIKPPKGEAMIERPDGRMKRYFTVAGMQDSKQVAPRDPQLPALSLMQDIELNPPDEGEINKNVVLIENTLLEFDIDVDVVDVRVGPTVTQYAVQPFREVANQEGLSVMQRTRISKIASLSSDLALSLSAKRLRLETPVPGHSYVGVEVPNKNPSTVALRSVYESGTFFKMKQKDKNPLLVPLGRDVAGRTVGINLAKMPHLLIAGTTGSGKSVQIASFATALILDNFPTDVRLVMLDPKMVELSRFNGIPHLIGPVETDMERIIGVLRWCTREMDRRYKLLEENAARNIDIFNSRLGARRKSEALPYIVILIDEIGDLMMSKPEETEKTITRLAQMARAVGMHLVVATQRPSVDVITGLIKANFPARMSFAVASSIDSRVILDATGAETLLGKGDMLYLAPDAGAPQRVQGCYVSDDEVRAIVNHWRRWYLKQIQDGRMEKASIAPWERGLTRRELLSETDPMLEEAIALVISEGEASASQIQRKLGVGYPRAARIMDLLEELGIVGEVQEGGRSRKVLIEKGKDPFKDMLDKRAKGG